MHFFCSDWYATHSNIPTYLSLPCGGLDKMSPPLCSYSTSLTHMSSTVVECNCLVDDSQKVYIVGRLDSICDFLYPCQVYA